ncbi:MAG: Na/Pi symporter [Xanthomonadales bacterium]|jgi:phosphate:Na+ symporter|nr:Na/Pi symporter [Xanthomonadales bacterium]
MSLLAITGSVIGGIGLLLFGMALMTDGLKLAAGKALRNILSTWTHTRAHALAAGALITGMVQSSSAVTVATIGFANAGLLTLPGALWLVYGSNVGTTMTGWIVALIGFKLKVEAFALPLVGIGVMLRLTGEGTRRAYIGQSIIGFGLLFLGIGVLADTFTDLGESFKLPVITEPWIWSVLVYIAVGMLLTTLMQSSSAALVIALSAAESGLIPLNTAAMVVIGANLGTTTTAILSVWGATPTAKRVALGHVIFNLVTATVAIAILTPLLATVAAIREFLALEPSPAVTLALFHTVFNVLGVALMWPLSGHVTRFLAKRFQTEEEQESRPRFLDRNVLALPHIAVQALSREVGRIRGMAVHELRNSLARLPTRRRQDLHTLAKRLSNAVGDYTAELNRTALPLDITRLLPDLLYGTQQLSVVLESVSELNALRDNLSSEDPAVQSALDGYILAAEEVLDSLQAEKGDLQVTRPIPVPIPGPIPGPGPGSISEPIEAVRDAEDMAIEQESAWGGLEARYTTLREVALVAAAEGRLSASDMTKVLRYATLLRRMLKQTRRASDRIVSVQSSLVEGTDPGNAEASKSGSESASELLD